MKTISIALKAHKSQPVTTLCGLLRVGPLPDGTVIGFTSLDTDVSYNDGQGAIIYYAHTGFSGSTQTATADLSVDNSEAQTLVAEFNIPGLSQESVDRGIFDKVPFVSYSVNYENLSDGHETLGAGTIGEQSVKVGGLVVLEQRSISQQARQSVVELDSLTCRVKQFGSQIGDERFPCGYNITPEWVSGTVSSVGSEATRQFDSTVFTQVDGYFSPGIVEFLSGNNAGVIIEIESFARIFGASVVSEVTTGVTWSQSSAYAGLIATAANMRDADRTTGAATNPSNPQWILADLGTAKSIGRIAVAGGNLPGWGGVSGYLNGKALQYSVDGITGWTAVSTIAGVDDTGTLFNFNFTAVSARYWRCLSVGYLSATEFRLYEVAVGGVVGGRVTLQFTLPNVMQLGDMFRTRRDCTRAWTGNNSCATYWGSGKGLHFRGEPYIPVADAVQVPGAET